LQKVRVIPGCWQYEVPDAYQLMQHHCPDVLFHAVLFHGVAFAGNFDYYYLVQVY